MTAHGGSTADMRRAAELLREWWPDGCECHEMERHVAKWLELVAHQIDEASHEFSMVPYPNGHDRYALRVALSVLAQEADDQ